MIDLEIAGVGKVFSGGVRVVDDVSLTVPGGRLVCFVGPSGCGKTTLLRIIAGLEAPTAGTIRYGDQDITRQPAHRRGFGMVFQSLALFPHLTVAQNICYPMKLMGMNRPARQARLTELLAMIQLPDIGPRRISALSGGQRQRVAVARALAQEPRLLLLDEPMSALDAKLREALQVELCLLQRRLKVTTILVTHDQREAMTMADRIVVMNHGRIEQYDTPDKVYAEPASLFVADFIGQTNLLKGEARDGAIIVDGAALARPAGTPEGASGAVTLAIRPEHLRLHGAGEAPANCIRAKIQLVRNVGASVEVHLNGGSVRLVGTYSPGEWRGFEEGQTVAAELRPEACRVFAGH
jgi:putative spermidine/putrescine transport system ATP-binding protein